LLLEGLIRLLVAPFVFAWRRLRAAGNAPAGVQASLADDMRAVGLLANAEYDAMYDRLAQVVIGDLRYRPSISALYAAECLFVALDSLEPVSYTHLTLPTTPYV